MISGAGVNAGRVSQVVTDFEDTLRGLDADISKFDSAKVDSESNVFATTLGLGKAQNQLNPQGPVGFASNGEVDMVQTNSPHASENKPRGWKRLVIKRAHAGIQNTTMQSTPRQRKRQVRDEENDNEVGVTGKKFCAMDTIFDQTAEAAGQPRREQ